MEKVSNIFERIMQIIEYYNIKSVNSFAKDYLKYDSSEKINRLKDPNRKPSIAILEDISKKFEEVNPEWLLLGKGEMLRNGGVSGDNNVVGNTHCGSINTGTITSDSVQELIKQLDVKDSQLKEKDAQIARLLSILEKTPK